MTHTDGLSRTIRELRGSRTREVFAREIGVTAQTVYRWELPDGAPEARRPRGQLLERILQLRQAQCADAAPVPFAPQVLGGNESQVAAVHAAIAGGLHGRWHAAERHLVGEALDASSPPEVRSLASAGLALIELILRGDARAALAVAAPAVAAVRASVLSRSAAAHVHAVAALAHAMPDARFFDVERVQAHLASVEALAPPDAVDARVLGCVGAVHAGFVAADRDVVARALARLDELPTGALPAVLSWLADEARGLGAWAMGQPAAARRAFDDLGERAEGLGAPLLRARALAFGAYQRLDDLEPLEPLLAIAQTSHDLARKARATLGLHYCCAATIEAEALLRLGRTVEALAVVEALERYVDETGTPPAVGLATQLRLYVLAGRSNALRSLAGRLRACDNASVRSLAGAHASSLSSLSEITSAEDGAARLQWLAAAERAAARLGMVQRDVLVFGLAAFTFAGCADAPDRALRSVQKVVEQAPSPRTAAHLRYIEGVQLARDGGWRAARLILEGALAEFESAGCRVDAAVTRHTIASFSLLHGEPDAAAWLTQAEAELTHMGLTVPPPVDAAQWRARRRTTSRPSCDCAGAVGARVSPDVQDLVSSLRRLSLRGVAPELVLQETVAAVEAVLPGHDVTIDEVAAGGAATGPEARDGATPDRESVEFGDGAGRTLRLSVAELLDDRERAVLAAVGMAAGAALEIASLHAARLAAHEDKAGPGEPSGELPGLVATSPAMRRLRAEIRQLSKSKATVIIIGESGVGKEVIARAIHGVSPRANNPFVPFNCAAVPPDLFEGQLFGYRKGAFTGALAENAGTVRAAHNGTLFLDEIGELPLALQPKLLRFLENGEIFPLGERRPVSVDVRILAATNRDLDAMVKSGRFREDLFYRLNVVPLHIPPLRERRADIPDLARHLLRQMCLNGCAPDLAPDALAMLTAHDWPGNVRELRNVLERSLAFTSGVRVIAAANLRMA